MPVVNLGSSCGVLTGAPVNCVGAWTDTTGCTVSGDTYSKQQRFVVNVPASGSGTSCTATNGAVQTVSCPMVWTQQGHWKDNAGRTLPNRITTATVTAASCGDAALIAGYNVFGLQYGGQCWAAKNLDYQFLGPGVGLNPTGDAYENVVYTIPTYVKNGQNPAAVTQQALDIAEAARNHYTESTYTYGGILYKVYTYTGTGTFTVTGSSKPVKICMVGGGGGGGGGDGGSCGGGGGGEVVILDVTLSPGVYDITLGTGGLSDLNSKGYDGTSSTIICTPNNVNYIARYGVGGGRDSSANGGYTFGSSYRGGLQNYTDNDWRDAPAHPGSGGGGGSCISNGQDAGVYSGGNGANGRAFFGNMYGGGGGGGGITPGTGGNGGGGAGNSPANRGIAPSGAPNTGGGGGGAY